MTYPLQTEGTWIFTRAARTSNLAELKNQLKEQEVASQLNKFLGSLERAGWSVKSRGQYQTAD